MDLENRLERKQGNQWQHVAIIQVSGGVGAGLTLGGTGRSDVSRKIWEAAPQKLERERMPLPQANGRAEPGSCSAFI